MPRFLVLGSKPEPVLPPPGTFDAVVCANASGCSAAQLGLPRPEFTVMSSIVPSAKTASNRAALRALDGLSTGVLYIYPRPPYHGLAIKKLFNPGTVMRATPPILRFVLKTAGYGYDRIVFWPLSSYLNGVLALCDGDAAVATEIENKVPSSGVIAAAIALSDPGAERVIISGFSFEITHAYADNPDIVSRGSAVSRHAKTDITVLARLAQCCGRLFTSEPVVHQRAGVPLVSGAAPRQRTVNGQ